MKRTFLTRNLFIGVLMGLVMVLGVQDTADAITKITKTASRDYQVVSISQEFTITFSVGVTGPRLKANHKTIPARNTDGDAVTIDRTATPYYIEDGTPGYQSESGVSRAAAHNYDQEAIAISSNLATLTLRKGSTPLTLGASARSLSEDASDNDLKLSGSVTLKGVATEQGRYVITITDVTEAADFPSDTRPSAHTPAPTTTFTIYVWRNVSDSRGSTIGDGDGLSDDTVEQYGTMPLSVTLTGANAAFAKVEFEVTRGPGRLYEDKDEDSKPDKSPSNRLTTFTWNHDSATGNVVNVILVPNRGTSHIRAWVSGNAPGTEGKSTEAIYSYGYSQLKKVSGDSPRQTAPASSRLAAPFVVQLVDSTGRTTIPGADITFTAVGGGFLEKDPSFPDELYADGFPTRDATTRESTSTTTMVETDSNGKASVFLVLGTSGAQSVTATFDDSTVTFTALIGETPTGTTRTPQTIEILPGTDGQRADENGQLEKALIVVVRDQYGDRLPGKTVEFEARDGGTILPPSPTKGDPGTVPTAGDASDRRRDINTNSSGMASVRYLAAEKSGAQKVTATLEEGSRRFRTFTINGAPSSGGGGGSGDDDDDDDNQPITRTISTSPSSITGAVGTTQTLIVSAGTATVRVVSDSALTAFITAGGTISGSGTSRSITLPDTPGSNYAITFGASGYDEVTVPITVTAPLANGTLTPTLGTRSGNQQPITVRAVRGGSAQSAVNITITGGATSYTRTTDSSGNISLIITLPTATNAHTLTARATGYDAAQIPVPAPQEQPRDPDSPATTRGTAGVADSIQISGQVFRTGRLNTQLDLPLSVRVLDGNGRGVEDVRVTFRLQTGQGRLSQRGNGRATAIDTDRNGYARAPYTPLSRGTSTVRVKAAGVTQTVTFTITVNGASDPETATEDPTSDTPAPQTYNVRDEIPISRAATLSFSGSRTEKGTTYTCVGPGECVVSYGTVVKGEIRATPEKTIAPQTYNVRDEIPISRAATLSFSGSRTEKGMTYTCVGSGECVVSYGTVVKGEIRATPEKTAPDAGTPRSMDVSLKVSASNRPVIYWIAGGALYRQASGDATQIAASAKAVVVDTAGGKLYYIEQTSERSGALHTANLDGDPNAQVVKTLTAAPNGLAVDTANGKLYLSNGWGKIQRMNLDGSQYETNFITGLTNPMHVAVANGNIYWTEGEGRVRAANLTGAKTPRNIVTGTGTLTGLAAGRNKVFWTEQTGTNRGRISSANPDGTGVTVVYPVTASVYGLAIDPATNRLYWTNGWGKVQRSANASRYQDVATGLMTPTAIAIGGPNSETAEKPPKSVTTAANKYDVNDDGTVDSKDSDALIAAVAAGKTDAKYDVNGDGKVDVADIVAVTANRSGGAAGAPTLLGTKFSALEVDRLQEQVDLLIATNDRSPAAMRTLVYLQQLIVMARPEKTQLLANYPNPFNPETWMPYQLATDTDVKITIYTSTGVVVRTLLLGQQSAGYYTDRERAAYWDGRNASGERVSSGVYFYQLETDTMSALRKMVILK